MITPNNSAVASKQNNAPAPPPQTRVLALLASDEVKARFHAVMTDRTMLDRFIGVLTNAIHTNPKIAECTEQSLMASMIKCANLKLEPNDAIRQQCFLIPRWNGKINKLECSWEIGAKGLIELAYRSGEVQAIACSEIYERDYFDVDWGTNEVTHKLPKTDRFKRGEVEGYWAQWIGKDGAKGRPAVMSKEDMVAFMEQYVQSVKDPKTRPYSPWTTAFDQMALKTVIKRCLKTAPISADDLRNGLDESDPQDDPRYAFPGVQTVSGGQVKYAADPMLASADMFRPRTIDAEYETQTTAPEPQPEPEPQATPAEPEPQDQGAIDEQHRLDMLGKVKDLVRTKKITNAILLDKTGMTATMIERATLQELTKFYMVLQ
jgi:recombination protein RecT